ncbi:hypothetical protein JMJ35_008557 [Cladonia borealis]|uniref:Heterokaryon incompatibility domain-containing protein n=1 Tax=Cladonia borealis TaxID=184061 RepID=A0AA39U713_9LECA|nr:hypothetical protein JMJ35_008557 [Cladonia borealis]
MDHLALPRDPILTLTEVPYLCSERYDVTIPFLEYPGRKGKPWLVVEVGQVMFERQDDVSPTSISELERFLQTWLFFGLLAEVLGDLYDHDVFVAESSDTRELILSTKDLQSLLEKRITWVATLEKTVQKQLYEHAGKCVEITWKARRLDFDPRVRNSIGAVAELIASAIDKAHLTAFPGSNRCQKPFVMGFYTEEMKEGMVEANWCPNDFARVRAKFQSIQLLYYYSRMKKPLSKPHHRNCTEDRCVAHSVNLSQYRTRHCEGCDEGGICEDVSIDNQPIMNILQSGALPLLLLKRRIDEPRKVSVELCSTANTGDNYVAISHVWSDGMGNPNANSLPQCHLARLSDIVDSMDDGGQRAMIWLDTFCCPVDPEAKKLALSRMRRTYFEARKVLVLDSTLYCYNSQDIRPAEINARILTSPWMRRLWCLQEGALARGDSLWVYFKDGPVHMPVLWRRLYVLSNQDLRYRRLLRDMFDDTLPMSIDNYYFGTPKRTPNLALLDRALSYRNTTVPSDEPLCISTLMDLNIDRVLPSCGEERMATVWDLIAEKNEGGLPSHMVFLEGPKLRKKGYHWAPSTLLPSSERLYSFQTRVLGWNRTPRGTITPEGLLAPYPGLRFYPLKYLATRAPATTMLFPNGQQDTAKALDHNHNPWAALVHVPETRLIFRDTSTQIWYQLSTDIVAHALKSGQAPSSIFYLPLSAMVARKDFAIILHDGVSTTKHQLPSEGEYQQGRVAIISEEKDGVIYAKLGEGVILAPLRAAQREDDVMVYEVAARLVDEVLEWEMSEAFDGMRVDGSLELNGDEAVQKLKAKIKELASHAVAADPVLAEAVVRLLGAGGHAESLWVIVANWFGHVAEGEMVKEGQMWCVD